ncbi:endonuclease/exonuclease/phosphatase family protein [Maribacter arenosus]|uniref:Endonuclease/exonuclease/phosphatase family protein n=1 Tax=Maribacter arenosus TaxID=1854708 RepID=A0ABR7V8B6_9FLAO|nr:endonuclease/exonuclease/phosphatase family protein [Maribacter arenosus]MBD0849923.1 endonuclease/exonuclease/phosphatase family protein [Maribacter arenosus]
MKFNYSDNPIADGEISIMTYNSHSARGVRWSRNPTYSDEITGFIALENPDIVCIQEYSITMDDELGHYPYKYQTPFYSGKSRQAIFSNYKIVETGSLNFPNSGNNALYADIIIKRDTIRIYNLHLQSLVVRAGSFKREQPQNLFRRLGKTIQKQQQQANLVKDHANKVSYSKIICGDFNNTQFSSVYHTIKGDMKDSFQEKGFGLGSTYDFKFLPFRIDYILADPELEIMSHKNFNVRMSDHRPVMASFRLKE